MPRDDEPLRLPPFGGFHVDAARRAQRLPLGSWRTLMELRTLCEGLAVQPPRWALDLLDHASALATELPAPVLEPLMSPATSWAALCEDPEACRWGERTGLWTPSEREAGSMMLTPLGHLVRALRAEDERRRDTARPELSPDATEDGTKGTVVFRVEDPEHDYGPASLERGDRSDPLFRGRWVNRDTAAAYARDHGHAFEG